MDEYLKRDKLLATATKRMLDELLNHGKIAVDKDYSETMQFFEGMVRAYLATFRYGARRDISRLREMFGLNNK